MTGDNQLLELIISGGLVKRFHTRDTIKENTVAQHSFGVAWFCYLLTGGEPSSILLMHALAHDLAESTVGDVPSPTKRLPGFGDAMEALEAQVLREAGLNLPELSREAARLLKLADLMDGFLFCALEARRGNLMDTAYYSYLCRVAKHPNEIKLLNDLIAIFNRCAAVPIYELLEVPEHVGE